MDDELEYLRQFSYMPSRIPVLDALEGFVPTGSEDDPQINELQRRTGFSRWFPVSGGHRVLILYEGGEYDHSRFTLVRGAWDHEHCKRCQSIIQPMTHCWVTRDSPFVILCETCHGVVEGTKGT
jgi:hypothetical protein